MFGLGRRPVERLDFIVAGAQKSGTTALNYYLKRDPRIALPVRKELHFFDNDAFFTGSTVVSYYRLHEMFPLAPAGSIAGENTPNYLYSPPALPRIRDYNPAIKLIILLRNPIDRAFSQWNMQRVRGIEPLDFLDAISAEPNRLTQLDPEQRRKFAYVDRGRYGVQLSRALHLFPPRQLLILKYEEFRAHQPEVVEKVFRFLGLSPVAFRHIEAHDIAYKRRIRAGERVAVHELLRDDIARLEQLLNWDCSNWR
ncbi:MAG: sulfotransferase family protein [Chthoniobacterales bacterium]